MTWDGGLLAPAQSAVVRGWLGAPTLIEDHSWGLVDTVVLHVRASDGSDVIVKAGGRDNHHIRREIRAHARWTAPLVALGRTGRMRHASDEANALVLDRLPGVLVEGAASEHDVALHVQAGAVLRALHDQERHVDDADECHVTAKARAWLDREHRIAPALEKTVRRLLEGYRPRAVEVVPTHGDYHPRNWLDDGGELRVIDFGRFDLRPAATDLCRLATGQWRRDTRLERAFLEAYGEDPRDGDVWRMDLLREAVSTAVWAYLVGDRAFEQEGHRMLDEAVGLFR
ncbi:aminoglycoside phosphotransferase family protein [Microbacterium sp. Marseille-Q6648]|uniref:phosphotransferase family protein n=1 Tax=Microbacterium sp. Marseille-Q6648 TaxID=2937991 RepID=UPI00203DFDA7|nr:aminoglycoside phosphotransferase family protein [Microbacterium sp. Marseille-Q6648]